MNNLFRQEDGQMAFLLVLVLPVVFLFFALPLDAGIWYLDHRLAQNQVDAAALAAVIALPANPNATVDTWLTKNGAVAEDLCDPDVNGPFPQYSHTVVTSDTSFDTVRVCVRRQSPAFFAQLVGIPYVYVSAVSTASAAYEPALYSIFANHPCPDSDPNLVFSGSDDTVTGAMHSNCNLEFGGNNDSFDGFVTYVGNFSPSDPSNTCNGGPCYPIGAGNVPMPINYTYDDVRADCTETMVGDVAMESVEAYWQDWPTKTLLEPGVYCNEFGKITLSGVNVTGNVTFAANEVSISGSDFNLTALWSHPDDLIPILVMGFCDCDQAIDASGSGGTWDGTMYAPNGQAKISGGSGLAIGGTIIADEIVISGSDITIVGNVVGEAALPTIWLSE